MAANARRTITITYSNDVEGVQIINAANNVASPAMIQPVTLTAESNTFEKPDGATAVTIVKPSDNETEIHIRPDGASVGMRLHDTDPDTISLHEDTPSIVLWLGSDPAGETPVDDLTGVRLFWS